MALTVDQNYKRVSDGSKWKILGTFACDTSYPANGYVITPQMFGLSRIDSLIIQGDEGYEFDYEISPLGVQTIQVLQTGPIQYSLNSIPVVTSVLSERLYYTPGLGTLAIGDAITGSISGATGTITSVGAREPGNMIEYTPTAGSFVIGDIITGSISGATGTISSVPLTVLAVPAELSTVNAVYDFVANTPLSVTAFRGTLDAGFVRMQTAFPTFYEAEVLQSSGITQLAWSYAVYTPNAFFVSALSQVPTGLDVSFLNSVEFEAVGS